MTELPQAFCPAQLKAYLPISKPTTMSKLVVHCPELVFVQLAILRSAKQLGGDVLLALSFELTVCLGLCFQSDRDWPCASLYQTHLPQKAGST